MLYAYRLRSLERWEQFPKSCPTHGRALLALSIFSLPAPAFLQVRMPVAFLSTGSLNSG